MIQNQIKRTLSVREHLGYLQTLLEGACGQGRTELAYQVCAHFGFYDRRGRAQWGGCLKALRELERAGHFELPRGRVAERRKALPRRLAEAVPPAAGVPLAVGEVDGLELVRVETGEQLRLWNELMAREHPQGAGPLVGRQLRYLIGSAHGWLGGLGFAAAALQLADRDRWIGWNLEQRRACLDRVVGLSRFLLRAGTECRNLASKVLSLALSALPNDFEQRYGYRPVLVESFVDTTHFKGTCYRAANWIEVGRTRGRGRQDRFKRKALPPKTIFVYPLASDFRTRLGLSADAGGSTLTPMAGLEGDEWSEHEFGGASLGDRRLSRRLVEAAAAKARVPDRTFSGVARGDWAAAKAWYRLIDQPDESAVTPANLLAPHRERTIRRMLAQKTVLCVQDGSDLDYNRLDRCAGLGVIGSNQTGARSRGLHMHSSFVLTTEGLPLGILRNDLNAPEERSPEARKPSAGVPMEEKKNFVWIQHHRDLVEAAKRMPNTRLVNVCDREADFFALFDEQRRNPRVELLVRAKHDRKLDQEPFKLFSAARSAQAISHLQVIIDRQSARAKKSKQKARPQRPGRVAQLTLRSLPVQLKPPREQADQPPVHLHLVHALEEHPPTDAEPVEWFLLTTLAIQNATDAEQCLRWYCLRWRIEDFHRVLKSGCRIEDLAHRSAKRLCRAISINLVIAWRIMLMTLMGREMPDLPADVLFSEIELRTLEAYAKKNT